MEIHGDGSIVMLDKVDTRAKCRHWRLKVSTDHGVKEKRFSGTYTQAKAELAKFKASLCAPTGEMKFSVYAKKWLRLRQRSGELKPQTLERDESIVRQLCGAFGGMRLCELTPSLIREGFLDMKEARNLSGTYLASLHVEMKAILEAAVDDGELAKNPMSKMKAPKRDKPNRSALTEEQFWGFLRAMEGAPMDSHTVGARMIVLSGMRRGEAVGVQWGDIEDNVIHVRRSVADSGRVDETKTPAGVRDIPMPNMLVGILDKWRVLQREKLAAIQIEQRPSTPVLTSDVGTRLNPQNLDRWWRNNRDAFSLHGVVLHELRHTYATMLANQGTPSQVLKSVLGWASISMADTYVHDNGDANRRAVDALSEYLDEMAS